MTERASNNRYDGDAARRTAYEQAMTRLAGRRSLRHSMNQQSIDVVEQHNGPVILGPVHTA